MLEPLSLAPTAPHHISRAQRGPPPTGRSQLPRFRGPASVSQNPGLRAHGTGRPLQALPALGEALALRRAGAGRSPGDTPSCAVRALLAETGRCPLRGSPGPCASCSLCLCLPSGDNGPQPAPKGAQSRGPSRLGAVVPVPAEAPLEAAFSWEESYLQKGKEVCVSGTVHSCHGLSPARVAAFHVGRCDPASTRSVSGVFMCLDLPSQMFKPSPAFKVKFPPSRPCAGCDRPDRAAGGSGAAGDLGSSLPSTGLSLPVSAGWPPPASPPRVPLVLPTALRTLTTGVRSKPSRVL